MVDKLWLRSDELVGSARITELAHDEARNAWRLRLDRSPFHPQGGGQKADRGRIGEATVLDVRHAEGGEVDHFVDAEAGLSPGAEIPFEVDGAWRHQMAALHSAGHLIAALVEARWPELQATQGHHWPGEARVDFAAEAAPPPEFQAALEQDLSAARERDEPIARIGDPEHDRRIQIGAYPAVPCGGTHLRSTGELNSVTLRKIKFKAGRLRVGYDAD